MLHREECARQIEFLIDGLTSGEQFAVECELSRIEKLTKLKSSDPKTVFDTWGFRLGRVHKEFEQHGLYDDCRNFDQEEIRGKNCVAKFSRISSSEDDRLLDPLSLSLFKKFLVPSHSSSALVGVCVPQVCRSHDLTSLGNTYLNSFDLEWTVHHCEKPLSFGIVEILVM